MTKKDFIALADAIREFNKNIAPVDPGACFSYAHVQTLADFCQWQNPRFNRSRWLDYIAGKCGPNGGAR